MSTTIAMELESIYALARRCLMANGCDDANADAVARTVTDAERDGAHSHGLFRIPGYVASLRSGKVDGRASPRVETVSAALIRVDGDNGFAPLALERGIPALAAAAHTVGVAALTISHTYHFAALWPETEAIAAQGLACLACTTATPMVAPAGATRAFFGTNPLSFAWPRPDHFPLVFDMATSTRAMGDTQIAARDGQEVAPGTGLDAAGKPTTDPRAIVEGGVLLPFGGYKGSAISLMIELLTAGLIGERFSYEAGAADNGDGGPARGGEFLLAFDPAFLAPQGWEAHAEEFFTRLTGLEGVRLPGERRHQLRQLEGSRAVNAELAETIQRLAERAPE